MTTPRKQREIWRVQSECGLTSSLDEPGFESIKEKEKPRLNYIPHFNAQNTLSQDRMKEEREKGTQLVYCGSNKYAGKFAFSQSLQKETFFKYKSRGKK